VRRTAAALAVLAVLAAGCEVRRERPPVGLAFLRVEGVARATQQSALSPVAWAPDGRRFAFGARDGVWVQRVDGDAAVRLAPGQVVTAVAWAPMAQALAYVDRGELWVVRADGSGRRRVPLPGPVTAMAWAPVGDRLAAVVRARGPGQRVELWWTSAAGNILRHVLWTPPRPVAGLGWFPDALYLFVPLEGDGGSAEWWKVRIAYPDVRLLQRRDPPAREVALAPGGAWVAFVAAADRGDQVFVVRPDGSGLRAVSAPAPRIAGLAWAHAGDKLAYAVLADEANAEVFVTTPAGPTRRLLTYRLEFPDPAAALALAWAPGDGYLAYGTNTGALAGPVWLARFARD
jgi:Tol biopolymer transport system component